MKDNTSSLAQPVQNKHKETYKQKLGGTGGTRTDDMKRVCPFRVKILFKVIYREVR